MQTNAKVKVKNEDIYKWWCEGKSGVNESKVLRTDGNKLYSYETIIGFTEKKSGQKTVVKFRFKGHRHMNNYTKRHIGELDNYLEHLERNHLFVYTTDLDTPFEVTYPIRKAE